MGGLWEARAEQPSNCRVFVLCSSEDYVLSLVLNQCRGAALCPGSRNFKSKAGLPAGGSHVRFQGLWLRTREVVSLFSFPDAWLHLSVLPNLASGERFREKTGFGNEITVNISLPSAAPVHRPTPEHRYQSLLLPIHLLKSGYWLLDLPVRNWQVCHRFRKPHDGIWGIQAINLLCWTDSPPGMGTQTTVMKTHPKVL